MEKYCIYKRAWGDIEAWEYIEDLEEAMSYPYIASYIHKYGVKETMPICMNEKGGFHTFDQSECIAIIESETWPSIASHFELFKETVNNKNFDYGWIDTLGNTYSCSYMGHAKLAADLVTLNYAKDYTDSAMVKSGINAPDDFLLHKGWIKVAGGNPGHIYYDEYVTDEAVEKLFKIKRLK